MMLKKKPFLSRLISLSLVLILALVPLAACSSSSSSGTASTQSGTAAAKTGPQGQEYGGILKIVNSAEGAAPLGVPWETIGIDTLLMGPCIETLAIEDVSGKLTPCLATDWSVDAAKKVIIANLRQGVKFHDGTDFKADAAVFSIQHYIDAKQAPGWTGVKATGDYQIEISFETYGNAYLNRLASRSMGMISTAAFEKNGIEWARINPVGTGPFKFESFQRGDSVKYVKFEDYWQEGKPYLDGITYLFIRDPMTQQAALQSTGEQSIDVLSSQSGEQAQTMGSLGMNVVKNPIGPISLIPDSKDPNSPLSKKEVREAISYAIDREGIVKARGFGIWTPAYQAVPEGWPAHIADFKNQEYNVAKAKELLAAAGYPNGFTTKIHAMPGLVDKDAMVAIQSQLAQVGITVQLEFPDSGGYQAMRVGKWDGFLAQHTRALANINQGFTIYWLSTGGQFPELQRPEGMDELILASTTTVNIDAAATQAINKALMDETAIIPVYNVYDCYIMKPNVKDTGFSEYSSSTIFLPTEAWISTK